MRFSLALLAFTLITSAAIFVASHPMLIRKIICKKYLDRRIRLAEIWYAALLKELNCLNFDEQTEAWKLQMQASQKLQVARQNFITSLSGGPNVRVGVKSFSNQLQVGAISDPENMHKNVKNAFENYKNECSEILAVIKKLGALKQKTKNLSQVQEIYSRHQIYIIQEPLISDVFRFKYREFIKIHDTFEEKMEIYLNGMGSEDTKRGKALRQSLGEIKINYETKFAELKEKLQDEIKVYAQNYGVGTPQYRKQIEIFGDAYKKELSKLTDDFRSECLKLSEVLDESSHKISSGPEKAAVLEDQKLTKKPTSTEIDAELEKLLEGYWQTDVIPQLRQFHIYLEEIIYFTFQTLSEDQRHVYEILQSLQVAKRRFGDALWHARRDAKHHLLEIHKQQGQDSPEYSQGTTAILDAWQENMAPHLKRFTEVLHETNDHLTNLFKQQNLNRGEMAEENEVIDLGDVRVGKIFDAALSSLIIDYDSCIENLSELDNNIHTPEGKYKVKTLEILRKARSILDKNILQLKKKLKEDLARENHESNSLEKLIESYRTKLIPLVDAFQSQLEDINSGIEQFGANDGHSRRRDLSRGIGSPWHLHVKNSPIESTPSLLQIINFNSMDETTLLAEPFLDDIFRECYRSVVTDFDHLFIKLQELQSEQDTSREEEDASNILQTSLSEYGKHLKTIKEETLSNLNALLKKLDTNAKEYDECVGKLGETSYQKLKSLRDNLDSKMYAVKKLLMHRKINQSSTSQKSMPEQSLDKKEGEASELTNNLMCLFREYWMKSILPRLQDYDRCLEDINSLPYKPGTEESKKIYKILRSLELSKRKFGDTLWATQYEAMHNFQICSQFGVKSGIGPHKASSFFDALYKNMEPHLTTFTKELKENDASLAEIYEHLSPDRHRSKFGDNGYDKSDINNLRLQTIFDDVISDLIFEYDARLEALCEIRLEEGSPQRQRKSDVLKNMQETRSSLDEAIRKLQNGLKDKLGNTKHRPEEISKLVKDYQAELAAPVAAHKSKLERIDNDLKTLNNNKELPYDRYHTRSAWPSWQLPKYLGKDVKSSNGKKIIGDQNIPTDSKLASDFPDNTDKNQIISLEPILYDEFQRRYITVITGFDKLIFLVKKLNCQTDTPLYQLKEDSLNQLNSAIGEYKKEFSNLKKESLTDQMKLRDKFVAGSVEYRRQLSLLLHEYSKKLAVIEEKFNFKRDNVNQLLKEKFQNLPDASMEKTNSNNLVHAPVFTDIDKELIPLLSSNWQISILPILCEYHHYLEEINVLQLRSPQKDGEKIYEILCALQLAKRYFGDALWSQRRNTLQSLIETHEKFEVNTPEYIHALEDIKKSWQQIIAPDLEKFSRKLSDVDQHLSKMYEQNALERLPSSAFKNIRFDDASFNKLFEDWISSVIIDYDSMLEDLSAFSVKAGTTEGDSKAKVLESVLNVRHNFWEKFLSLKEELHSELLQHKGETDVLEKLLTEYRIKIEVTTATFKSNLDSIRNSWKSSSNNKQHPRRFPSSAHNQDTSEKPVHELTDKQGDQTSRDLDSKQQPYQFSSLAHNQDTLEKPVTETNDKQDDHTSRDLENNHSIEEQEPLDIEAKKGNEDVTSSTKTILDGETDLFKNQPVLPEPYLDDIFRASYRNNLLCFDSLTNRLIQLKCHSGSPEYKMVHKAIKQFQAELNDYVRALIELKRAAVTDLFKVFQKYNPGSPEYWQQVSLLMVVYGQKLKTLQDEFQVKLSAIEKLLIDTFPSLSSDYNVDTASKELHQGPDFYSENSEWANALDSYWLSMIFPQLQVLHSCLKDINQLTSQQNVDKKEQLHGLLTMLQLEKRRLNDALWQAHRDAVNSIRGQTNFENNHSLHAHILADALNVLRRKIAPHLSNFKDKINITGKSIFDLYESSGLKKSTRSTDKYDDKTITFDDSRLEKLFRDNVFLLIIEYDSRLEDLSTLIFDINTPEGHHKTEALKNLDICLKDFKEAFCKLKADLHGSLLHKKYDSDALEKLFDAYHTKISDTVTNFQSKLDSIDIIIKDLKSKQGVPDHIAVSGNSLVSWRTQINPKTGSNGNADSVPKGNPEKPGIKTSVLGSETHLDAKNDEIVLQEPFLDDTFLDEYRAIITSYDNVVRFLKEQEYQPDSSLHIDIQDALILVEDALMKYKENYKNLRDETIVSLTEIRKELDVYSKDYRDKVSALLKICNDKLKILHDKFISKRNDIRESFASKVSASAQIHDNDTIRNKRINKATPNVDSELETLLGGYWKTEVMPKLQIFLHFLEDINYLTLQLTSVDLKRIYNLLRSLQSAKRQFGDALWHGRRDVTEQLKKTLKGLPVSSADYLNAKKDILTSWQRKMTPQLDIFSAKLEQAEELLVDLYNRHNLKRNSLLDSNIFDFEDARFQNLFYDIILIIFVEYDSRLDDISKLILDLSSTEGRLKSDAFTKLFQAWSTFFSSILKIKEKLIAELQTGKRDAGSISRLLEIYRSKLEATVSNFRSLLASVDSVLKDLMTKLGLSCRKYSISVSLSPWCLHIETDFESKTPTSIIKAVAKALL